MIGVLCTFIPERFSHEHIFFKYFVKECVLNIQLPQVPLLGHYNGQNETNCNRLEHWTESVLIIKTILLFEPFCHQSCLIAINGTIYLLLDLENPLGVKHIYTTFGAEPSATFCFSAVPHIHDLWHASILHTSLLLYDLRVQLRKQKLFGQSNKTTCRL